MATVNDQLQAMNSLTENWDGYGAAAPTTDAIALAQEFVGLIEGMPNKPAGNDGLVHVTPTRIGGVLIEWENGDWEHEVEIDPDRSIRFLHHQKTTGQIETRRFSP